VNIDMRERNGKEFRRRDCALATLIKGSTLRGAKSTMRGRRTSQAAVSARPRLGGASLASGCRVVGEVGLRRNLRVRSAGDHLADQRINLALRQSWISNYLD